LRGYNLSSKPKGNDQYTVDYLVNDVLGLAKHFGYNKHSNQMKFNLVGHDWGGIIAWTLASLHPEVLNKLCIINSPHPRVFQSLLGTSRKQIFASSYINKFLAQSAEEKLKRDDFDLLWRFGFKELVEKKVFNDEDRLAHVEAWSQEGAVSAMLASYRAARFQVPETDAPLPIEFDVSQTLANTISVPTQVIWGLDDTALTADNLIGLKNYVETLSIHEVPNAGHGVIHERPALISQYLKDFFLINE